jgi:uncharacterized protein with HEPN domain
MQHDPRAWLWNVRLAADSIAAFVEGRNFAEYAADLMLRSAVERQFEIAGEALSRLSREAPDIAAQLPELRRAVAMRNALIHGYRESTMRRYGRPFTRICLRCAPRSRHCWPSWGIIRSGCVDAPVSSQVANLVGAAGFEPTTPSPPD